jgi:hypothetical protein
MSLSAGEETFSVLYGISHRSFSPSIMTTEHLSHFIASMEDSALAPWASLAPGS